MLLYDLYSEYDISKLSEDDYKEINKKSNIPDNELSGQYIYNNLGIIMAEDSSAYIINHKVLAGQVTVKWYTFEYTDTFNQDDLINLIENEIRGYDVPYSNIDINNLKADDIVNIYKDEGFYIIRIVLEKRKRRNFWEKDELDSQKEIVTVVLNPSDRWIEVRAKNNYQNRVIRLLENSLKISQNKPVEILKKFNNDINEFKNNLPNSFWFSYKANPQGNIDITDKNRADLVIIINALDEYYKAEPGKDRDIKIIEVLSSIDAEEDEFSFTNTILAGLEDFSLKIRDESEKGIENQGFFSIIKDCVNTKYGYIAFSISEGGKEYTIKLNTTSSSIYFATSVTEDVIEYMRNIIL